MDLKKAALECVCVSVYACIGGSLGTGSRLGGGYSEMRPF